MEDPIDSDKSVDERRRMIEQISRHGVKDARILSAMEKVPRHLFIPVKGMALEMAYGDHPLPIGYGQTISQPYIVAYMTERLDASPGEKILDVGTGSGYQATVLAEIGCDVYTIELEPELAEHACNLFKKLGYDKIHCRRGNGYEGWAEHAPFDGIIAACAPEQIPRPLVEQLAEGGRMILPVGGQAQRLVIVRKEHGRIVQVDDLHVRFVPMRGEIAGENP